MLLAPVGLLLFLLFLVLPVLLFLRVTKYLITPGDKLARSGAVSDSSISTRQCFNCKAIVSSAYKYCPFCNTVLQKTCFKCGVILNPTWKHCPACGQEN